MASSDQLTDARARLLAHFAGDTAEHKTRWSQLWDQKNFLPWDRYVSPQYSLDQHLCWGHTTYCGRAAEVGSSVLNLNTYLGSTMLILGPSIGTYLFLRKYYPMPWHAMALYFPNGCLPHDIQRSRLGIFISVRIGVDCGSLLNIPLRGSSDCI